MIDYPALVDEYLTVYGNERDALRQLALFLRSDKGAQPDSRANMSGHITASCLLVDALQRRVLLFDHPRYRLALQPGGHIEPGDASPLAAATRKLHDETPFTPERVRHMAWHYNRLVPVDIDSHVIDADATAGERSHWHHDFRYVYLAVGPQSAERELRATRGPGLQRSYQWFDIEQLAHWGTFERVSRKLEYLLSPESARQRFYVRLTHDFAPPPELCTVIVTHVLPDAYEFLDALRTRTKLLSVIPKPKSVDPATLARLRADGFPIAELERRGVEDHLRSVLEGAGPTVLLDIGGWFSSALAKLADKVPPNLVGIVEDTRNGQDKYEEMARQSELPVPVVSIAESHLKANEDFLVGQSVVFSADAILRGHGRVLEYMSHGVIGYGKIGRSITRHLQDRGIKPFVVERDPLRRMQAYRERALLRERDWVGANVDILFCATGSQATNIVDFRTLKSGAYVLSVTSSDDEFDFALLEDEYEVQDVAPYIKRCRGKRNYFYLVNDGNAANFLHGAVLDEFIQLVKGGIWVAASSLGRGESLPRLYQDSDLRGPGFPSLLGLTDELQGQLCDLWLETVLPGVPLTTQL